MIVDAATSALSEQAADPVSYTRALLNILSDFSDEKTRLNDVQRAMQNILEDSGAEKQRLEAAQKATLNILEDFSDERVKLADVQSGVLNILEDFAGEKERLEATQKAVLNILEDFDAEKNKVEQANREMVREIAERKQAEEGLRQAKAAADAANRELEAFSYSVAHDLRAPLRALAGFSRILLEDYAPRLEAECQRYLNLVRGNAQQMSVLIDDLLSYSRLSRQEVRRQTARPAEIARGVLEDLQHMRDGRQVNITIGDLPDCQADPKLLRQVYANLLGNALKFTRHRATAEVEIGCSNQNGQNVYYVKDNGAGFDMQYAGKLFGVFQRLHRAAEFEGTGVGLAIVQRIIHRHQGRVWAEAAVDHGATISFTLGDAHE